MRLKAIADSSIAAFAPIVQALGIDPAILDTMRTE